MNPNIAAIIVSCCASLTAATSVHAADWPHQRGPHLNGHAAVDGGALGVLAGGSAHRLANPVTDGFAAPIITGGRVIYGDLQKGKETFHAVKLSDAEAIWHEALDEPHKDGFGTGPRCAPVSDGEIVLMQSCKGELHCVDAETGDLLWRKNYLKDFNAPYTGEKGTTEGGARHGYNASPCIDGDHVIALAGGPGAAWCALKRKPAGVVWQSQDDQAAYSPPLVATLAGVEQVVCFTVKGVIGLDRADANCSGAFR